MKPILHVVVGLVFNQAHHILIAQRSAAQDHAHAWEFPGGKVNPGETEMAALQRELSEEVSLDVVSATPFQKIEHEYERYHVVLHIFKITAYQGRAHGAEGQEIRWVAVNDLPDYEFPEANQAIIHKLLSVKS